MKVKNQKESKKNEFRQNKDTLHPKYIYAKIGNRYKFIGITHSDITQGTKNIELEQNPNPNDKRKAFFRPKTEEAATNRFRKKEKGWKLSKKDKSTAQTIINKKNN